MAGRFLRESARFRVRHPQVRVSLYLRVGAPVTALQMDRKAAHMGVS
ncbi:hypothetical protein GCM10008939_24710 [Deinococcus aquiradiocola]|uniref:Uncharacterized protein n=1 Tax=Deinococcus aquiradiocola TaxID=393059 RepID=A0A917PI29_9DEIO|nr:hypothetical protein GCM10008939_24710 [Deinococcus aquiradiocola]